jgi:hypothetical protein
MSITHSLASRTYVNSVKQRSGNVVEMSFKEDHLGQGNPKTQHLRQLFESLGISVYVGQPIGSTPFLALNLTRKGAPLTKAEVVRALASNDDIELSAQIAQNLGVLSYSASSFFLSALSSNFLRISRVTEVRPFALISAITSSHTY